MRRLGVRVRAGSRLHLGFYALKFGDYAYGSVGLYIEEPRTIVEIGRGSSTEEGPSPLYVEETRALRSLAERVCGEASEELSLRIEEHPPRHVGLGSTTQILLAAGLAISRYCGSDLSAAELAVALGRGRASGVGILGFERGGIVVDGGRKMIGGKLEAPRSVEELPKLIFRTSFPEDWLVVLAIPKRAAGIRGSAEDEIISRPVELDKETRRELLEALHFRVVRGVLERDLALFGSGVNAIQETMGELFAPYQGGKYATRETWEAVEAMRALGAAGAGQSSWGPLAYGFFESKTLRAKLAELRGLLNKAGSFEVRVVRARNRGREVRALRSR